MELVSMAGLAKTSPNAQRVVWSPGTRPARHLRTNCSSGGGSRAGTLNLLLRSPRHRQRQGPVPIPSPYGGRSIAGIHQQRDR